MRADILLCPCCASHLRPPAGLQLMRCNQCDAELASVQGGGVRGLALLPAVGDVPYSTPQQRARISREPVDTSALVADRRSLMLQTATRRLIRWTTLFRVTAGLAAAVTTVGATGMYALVNRPDTNLENATLAVLGAIVVLPLLGYTAMFLQSRAALARADAAKWANG
ncbi:MAG: hypothetical protein KF696_14155 [Planctomycetes bacterium]|nr:hypothetical protein [Planctomycetota bacterium]MCW8136862.1 hypothetical protein [Planctomycetota bacterium]